jgi:hypothetical protein
MSVPSGTRSAARALAGSQEARSSRGRARLTGRGSVLVMILLFLAGCLIAAWSGLDWPAGVGYAAGVLLAAGYARREALLLVVITPPVIFATTLIAAELVTAGGSTLLATTEGTILVLAAVAPWLFCGTAACVLVAWLRGLPRCVRDLRSELAGRGAADQ